MCVCGVLCVCWCWCLVVVLRGVVWCGVVCSFVYFCVVFLFFLSILFFLFLALSLSLSFFLLSFFLSLLSSLFSSSFSSLFSLLFLFFFSLLFSPPNTMERTYQPTRRPTSRHLNVIWRRASAQQSVLSLLPSHPLLKGIILHYSFTLIQKNRRQVKLQSLQFYINSKTIKLQRVKSVIILAAMVWCGRLGVLGRHQVVVVKVALRRL